LARPSTAGGAQAGKDVDGRHEAGHDTVGTVEPLSRDAGTCAVTIGTCVVTVGTCAVTRVLALAIPRFQLRAEDFIAVIDGMQTDAETVIVAPDMAALDLYCDQVASAVGRLSVRAFGDTSAAADRVAYSLGRALQLTNILRDIKEDAERGRIYLPREYLDDAGVPADPATIVGAPGLPAVCARLAERAHGYFRDASAVMELCNRTAMKPARIMAATYDSLLSALERRGWRRLDEPVSLPKWKKLWIACRYGLT